nr:tRNA pseudouridine(13) synthase TruD [Lysobacter sp. CAU 1642]
MPSAFGGPVLTARIRSCPEDFIVEEQLGFTADGEGEHAFLEVEKRGANTAWVAGELARWAGIPLSAVGYAGLKDRHAVTRQTFTLHLPGRETPANLPEHPEYRVLGASRHRRKLPRGALEGNHFVLTLRDVEGDLERIEARLAQIRERGVPNWFGEQRFGRDGGNLERARALFAGRRMRRDQASILISAVRSAAFNRVLAARVADDCWDRPVTGEVFMLAGGRSIFGPEPLDQTLVRRCAEGDLHPTAALWGSGEPRSSERSRDYDLIAREIGEDLIAGLERAGLRQERRACRLLAADLAWRWPDQAVLELSFRLPAGAYATALLAELGECSAGLAD